MTDDLSKPGVPAAIEVGPYRIDFAPRSVHMHGQRVAMKPRAFEVAALIFSRPGTVLSRSELFEKVWGRSYSGESRTIDVHVSWIRKSLELDGRHGWLLHAVHQQGYRLEAVAPRRRVPKPAR